MGQERYRMVETYSTGMKQRVKLAQALVHDPQLLFLDEPTNGLDPEGREHILRLIGSLFRECGITVVISSHLLPDIDRICDRVIIMAGGRVLEHDTIANLKRRRKRLVEFAPASEHDRFQAALGAIGFNVERLSNGRLRVETDAPSLDWAFALMRDHRLPPADIFSSPNALHALFVQALAAAEQNTQEAAHG
jgi:ABC-2 type transport system ATP-binding protein